MSQILTLEIDDQVFAAIQQQAESVGMQPERLAAALLEQNLFQVLKSLRSETDKELARSNFERHFGTLALSSSTNLDK